MTPVWRRMDVRATRGTCSTRRCNEHIVVITLADKRGRRGQVSVCPQCDGAGPIVANAIRA